MGRTMPSECDHGYIYDWGDFGCQCDEVCECPEGAFAPEDCPEGCNNFHDETYSGESMLGVYRNWTQQYGEYLQAAGDRAQAALANMMSDVDGTVTLQIVNDTAPSQDGFKVPQRANLLWLGIDLDGTLAEPIWTPENPHAGIGDPIGRNVAKLREAVDAGYKVVIHTSRPDSDYELIEAWLNLHDIPFKAIRTGKPLCALYIDDRGRHAEEESWLPNVA